MNEALLTLISTSAGGIGAFLLTWYLNKKKVDLNLQEVVYTASKDILVTYQAEVKILREENAKLHKQILSLQKQVNELKSINKELSEKIGELTAAIKEN